jgi:hypothetical protein
MKTIIAALLAFTFATGFGLVASAHQSSSVAAAQET